MCDMGCMKSGTHIIKFRTASYYKICLTNTKIHINRFHDKQKKYILNRILKSDELKDWHLTGFWSLVNKKLMLNRILKTDCVFFLCLSYFRIWLYGFLCLLSEFHNPMESCLGVQKGNNGVHEETHKVKSPIW